MSEVPLYHTHTSGSGLNFEHTRSPLQLTVPPAEVTRGYEHRSPLGLSYASRQWSTMQRAGSGLDSEYTSSPPSDPFPFLHDLSSFSSQLCPNLEVNVSSQASCPGVCSSSAPYPETSPSST